MFSAGTQKIKDVIEQAFLPFRCVVEISRFEERLRFKVVDANDQAVIEVSWLILRQLRDEAYLATVISSAREAVEMKGHSLAPWSLT